MPSTSVSCFPSWVRFSDYASILPGKGVWRSRGLVLLVVYAAYLILCLRGEPFAPLPQIPPPQTDSRLLTPLGSSKPQSFAIGLSRASARIIRQNLVIALGVIAILLIASGFGIISPRVEVVLHEGTTIVVVLNALRLLAWHEPNPLVSRE